MMWFFKDVPGENDLETTRSLKTWLGQGTFRLGYKRFLRRLLTRVDIALRSPTETALFGHYYRASWSHGLLSLTMGLALAYPVLSFLVRWTIVGEGEIGEVQVIPSESREWIRAAAFAGFALCVPVVYFAVREWGLFALAGLVLLCVNVFAIAGDFSVAVAAAFAGLFAVAALVSQKSAITAAAAAAGAMAGALATGFGIGTFATISVAVSVAALVGIAASAVLNKPGHQSGHPIGLLLSLVFAGFAAICAAIILSPSLGEISGLLLFLGVLPLLNGVADFASVGMTRWSLRLGLRHNLGLSSFLDLLAALLIFVALGTLVIAVVHFVRPQDGKPLLELKAVFTELRNPKTRGDYWWLFIMLFSTLIPTVLHLSVVILSFFTLIPGRVQHWIAGWLDAGQTASSLGRLGRVSFCALSTLALFAPFYALWWVFGHVPGVVGGLVALFYQIAVWMGAVTPTGQPPAPPLEI